MIYEVKDALLKKFDDANLAAISRLAYLNDANKLTFKLTSRGGAYDILDAKIVRLWKNYADQEREDVLASFTVTTLPGDGDVIMFNAAYVPEGYRHHGIGSYVHGLRLEACKAAKVPAVMATVHNENVAERKILFAHGWHQMNSYVPYYTRGIKGREAERIEIWMKEL